MGVGDAGYGIGQARSGRGQGNADLARQLGMSLRHMHRGALVAYVYDSDAFGIETHPDGHDVPAAEREDPLDAARAQCAGDIGGDTVSHDCHDVSPASSRAATSAAIQSSSP